MKMYVQIQGRAETLNEGDCSGTGCCMGEPGFVNQMSGNAASNYAQGFAH